MKKKLKSMLLGTAIFGAMLIVILPAISSAEEGSWTLLKSTSDQISDIDVSQADPSQIYAFVFPEGVLKSIDSGKNWNTVGFEGIVSGKIAISPINPDVVFINGYNPQTPNTGLWKSIDGGIIWKGIPTPSSGIDYVTFYPFDPSQMFAKTQDWGGGILRSTDGGEHWFVPQFNYIYPGEFAFHPTDPNRIWVAYSRYTGGPVNRRGVAYSTDGGWTWSRVEFGDGWGSSLVVDQKNPTMLYVGVEWSPGYSQSGVWESTDGGFSWTRKNTGLPNTISVVGLAIDKISGSLYAATPEGVFFSEDGAESWTKISGSPQSVSTMALSPDGTRLYVGTSNGIYVFTELVNQPPVADADGPHTGNEGSPITFDGSDSSDPDGTIVLYEWDLDGDGLYDDATGSNPSYTWNDDYSGTIGLKVTDNDGLTDTDSTTVTVNNVPPTASATNDGPKDEGTSVTVTASQVDPGVDTFTYSFDWNNDGIYEIVDQTSPSAQYTFMDNGIYNVGVRVRDDDGGIGTATTDVTVLDLAPTAEFTFAPELQNEGSPVQFTDQSISYPDVIVSWNWNFGDTGTSADQNPSHAYGDNGIYTVTLTVTDDDGGVGTDTLTVTVNNVAPTVTLDASYYVTVPITLRIAGQGKVGDSVALEVIQDGSVIASDKIIRARGSPNEQEVTILAAIDLSKQYSGRVVFDTETALSGGTPVWVAIDGIMTKVTTFNTQKNDPSSYHQTYDFALSGLVSVIGKKISFTGSATDPGEDDLTFDWLFGDGGTASMLYPWPNSHSVTETVEHTYSAAGSYTVNLDVTDDDGGVGSASKTIVVS